MQLLQKYVKDEEHKRITSLFKRLKTYRRLLNASHLNEFWTSFFNGHNIDGLDFTSFADFAPSDKEKFTLQPEDLKSLSQVAEIRLYCEGLTLMYLVK